jgi:hypothetical protein
MMYLTSAAGYCDHVVGERTHASHILNALRRLDRPSHVHRNLLLFGRASLMRRATKLPPESPVHRTLTRRLVHDVTGGHRRQ